MTIATCPKCHRPVDSECRFCIEDDPVEAESVPDYGANAHAFPIVTHPELPIPCGDDIPVNEPGWHL